MISLTCTLLFLAQSHPAGFEFQVFKSSKQLELLKDAKFSEGRLRLAGTKKYQTGAAWFREEQPVSKGFETTFRFRLSEPADNEYGGADGLAFVLQTMGTSAIAGRGAAGGFSPGRGPKNPKTKGIPRSLAIFFDTFKNEEESEASGNSVGLFTNGDGVFLPRRLSINSEIAVNLKDGQEHEVRVDFKPPQLNVYLDQAPEPVLSASVDISAVTGSEGKAFVGFTAATGEGFQNHEILSWTFRPLLDEVSSSIQFATEECLPDRTLCTPANAKIDRIAPNRYSIRLPAHLEWGASIDSAQTPKISKLRGTVCWNPQSKTCNGPEGDARQPRASLLDPGSIAGTLVQQRRGDKIFFSINPTRSTFEKNEGYFEFEVDLNPDR